MKHSIVKSALGICILFAALCAINCNYAKADILTDKDTDYGQVSTPTPKPAAPTIELTEEYGDTILKVTNYSYNYQYEVAVYDKSNPANIVIESLYDGACNISTMNIRYYGDYSVSVRIIDSDNQIIVSSDELSYSRHVELQNMNPATDLTPTIRATNIRYGSSFSVYRSANNDSNFVKVADLTCNRSNTYYEENESDNSKIIYKDMMAVPGVTYYYRIQTSDTDNNGLLYYDNMSNTISGIATTGSDITTTMTPEGYIRITTSSNSYYFYSASYTLYKATQGDTSYTKVKTISSTYSPEWTDKNVVLGKTYYYMVVKESNYSSQMLLPTQALCTYGQAKISHKTYKPSRMKVTWKKVNKATGYMVYLRKPGKTNFKYYKTFKNSKRSFTMKVSNGKQYGIKIVAVGTVNGTRLTGADSIYEPYGDYYGFANEPYESKQNRIYKGFKQSSSWSVIDKQMTTIKIKVWDFKSGMSGAKVTKTKYLTCHKRLAPTLKKIFAEIYKGKEKAPIYEVGGYSRRSGEHGNGMAVDINSYYNAMFDGGKPTAGRYWNPKKYAYSIKRHGDIENAFEKYGFSRGFWGDREDYMHFSYFGT